MPKGVSEQILNGTSTQLGYTVPYNTETQQNKISLV